MADHDELEHLADGHVHSEALTADPHKAAQSAYFDRAQLAEFEIERPFGSPPLYEFLLTEKFRRSVAPLGSRLDGWTALVVCGGSGMDGEFLARAGADVVTSDISLGAAKRVSERARRHGNRLSPIVADVEHLPFDDATFDLVYVHDGLHHLEDPVAGIAEMARVARRAVAITEPARATATAIAVRLGLALAHEEAGNRVARLQLRAVAAELERSGLTVVHAARYAMYYRHYPGPIMSLLSRPSVLPTVVRSYRVADRLLGRFGNKLTIVARRDVRLTATA
jgi:ubiquinone/menaquinone biosynthesis C-methylase UbiE